MGQFERNSRQRIIEELPTPVSASRGPWKRARGSSVLGPLTTLILVVGVVVVVSGCSAVEEMIRARRMSSIDGLCAEFQVLATDESEVTPEALEQTRLIIENRIDATGVAEPIVLSHGLDGIEVALPGIDPASADADHILGLIGTSGVLAFTPVPPVLANEALAGGALPAEMADVEPLFEGGHVTSARIGQDSVTEEIVVSLEFDQTAARLFDEHAEAHYRERFAIVLDGVIESAPSINATRFGGQAVISGDFTVEEATNLVTVLKFGSLPLEIREVGARACGGASPQVDAGS